MHDCLRGLSAADAPLANSEERVALFVLTSPASSLRCYPGEGEVRLSLVAHLMGRQTLEALTFLYQDNYEGQVLDFV